jgi:DNA-binding XRE family transcriptional regulator
MSVSQTDLNRDQPSLTLEQARELVGLSQAALARRAGLSRQDIYDIESGNNQRPSWQVVGRIVQAIRDSGMPGLQPEQIFPLAGKA